MFSMAGGALFQVMVDSCQASATVDTWINDGVGPGVSPSPALPFW